MSTAKKEATLPTKEEVLMDEDALLEGLLEASKFKTDESTRKLIRIARNGKALLEFHIRPLDEGEINSCHKSAAKYAPSPMNRDVRIEVDVDYVRLRSLKIYTATISEDRKRLWDSKALQEKLGVLTAVDMIDAVLMAGEKDAIDSAIDEISGYNVPLVDVAKNLSTPEAESI